MKIVAYMSSVVYASSPHKQTTCKTVADFKLTPIMITINTVLKKVETSFWIVNRDNLKPKSPFLTVLDLRLSIVSSFSIARFP